MSVQAKVKSLSTLILPSPLIASIPLILLTLGPGFNLPFCPLSPLCQWKIPPAWSQNSKSQTKHWLLWPKSLACSQKAHTQPCFHIDGSNTCYALNDGLVIMENECICSLRFVGVTFQAKIPNTRLLKVVLNWNCLCSDGWTEHLIMSVWSLNFFNLTN